MLPGSSLRWANASESMVFSVEGASLSACLAIKFLLCWPSAGS